MKRTDIKPCGHNVLVEPVEVERKTAGGIYLPDQTVEKEQYAVQRGKILAIGNLADAIGASEIGKTALFGRYAGALIDHDGVKYRLIDAADIKGVIDDG